MPIRAALVPIAGLGTRMGPIARAVPKALLPLPATGGGVRPVLHHVCAEAVAGGAERIALILSPWMRRGVRRYLDAADDLPDAEIEPIEMPAPTGLGAAVALGRDFAGGEPVLVLLGDHVHRAAPGAPPCARQVADAMDDRGGAVMIGVQVVGEEQLASVGVAAGEPIGPNIYRCTAVREKPDAVTARTVLRTPGLAEGESLAHAGVYAFPPEIFDCLDELAGRGRTGGGELELTDAQQLLLRRRPDKYFLCRVAGEAMDTGTPAAYKATFLRLAQEENRTRL